MDDCYSFQNSITRRIQEFALNDSSGSISPTTSWDRYTSARVLRIGFQSPEFDPHHILFDAALQERMSRLEVLRV